MESRFWQESSAITTCLNENVDTRLDSFRSIIRVLSALLLCRLMDSGFNNSHELIQQMNQGEQ